MLTGQSWVSQLWTLYLSSCHTISSGKFLVWKWLPRQNSVAPFSGPTSTKGMKTLIQCAGKMDCVFVLSKNEFSECLEEFLLQHSKSFSLVNKCSPSVCHNCSFAPGRLNKTPLKFKAVICGPPKVYIKYHL